jgi:hypothetical protein
MKILRKRGEGRYLMRILLLVAAFAAVLEWAGVPVEATPITFTASGTNSNTGQNLSASVTFDTDTSGNLIVTLTNTSTADVVAPSDVLTAVFFNISGDPTLTGSSALLNSGSTVLFAPSTPVSGTLSPSGPNVGGEWAYNPNVSSTDPDLTGTNQGISSAGFGIFGPGNRFNTSSNLQGPDSPDGLQYGLTSAGDNPTTGNSPVTGGNALIKNSVVFTLSGLPAGFDPSTGISNVVFQYGTSLTEPSLQGTCINCPQPIPEPASVLLLGSGLAGIGWLRKRFVKD